MNNEDLSMLKLLLQLYKLEEPGEQLRQAIELVIDSIEVHPNLKK